MRYKYKIAVSGASQIKRCSKNIKQISEEIGKEIIRQNCILITGATTGAPYYSALGAKKAGGFSIGFSPASTEKEHLKRYRLPDDVFDLMVYTGFNYAGRNLLMTRASDAVIVICGRIGTLNEFTIAFEDKKPIGVLEGSGGTADLIRVILGGGYRGPKKTIFSKNPKELVAEVIKLIEKEKGRNHKIKNKK
jgi:uncharacterized protein (TIGR00725 family)